MISGAKPAITQTGMQPSAADRTLPRPAMNNPYAAQARPMTMAEEADKPTATAGPKRSADPTAGSGEPVTTKKPSKPLKLDPSLLQKVLQSRNANQ